MVSADDENVKIIALRKLRVTILRTYSGSPPELFCETKHKIFEIVDPKKVLRDFESCFVKSPRDGLESDGAIVDLIPTKSHNFHCMGVVIEIMRTTFYSNIPKELDISLDIYLQLPPRKL
ncbi:BDM_1a_G0031740.mRNA.1.CDS.1 [Saccharomyces cerevisiae]|nr:AHG_G0025650.mRNA.1.CDS.1 [Saccharomyces cerevisiae]CAI4577835.1 BDM_1a_G0031740.mRNA.1.CDS.1 [Saccharomyces cerevisiae]CAI6720199.1 AHG_G0025650.mRNA.1.CDS.1 [Saccharomyces cerevisiae]CAI7196382.1 BDM_1a_G0031740.mRNA.1.CDS.1 [Saccharomyces cerevisiae]